MQTEENSAKRESESMAMLQKLIRLNSKDCNFHFKDDIHSTYFKVSYPQTNIENNSNEVLLRQFWHHIHAHYFKRIEQEELKRLQYAALLSEPLPSILDYQLDQSESALALCPQFHRDMHSLFSESYLQTLQKATKTDRQTQIWTKEVLAQWKAMELEEGLGKDEVKKTKLIYSKFKENRRQRRLLKKKKQIRQALEGQNDNLIQLLQALREAELLNQSPIDQEITNLQKELAQLTSQSMPPVQLLSKKVEESLEDGQMRLAYKFGEQVGDNLQCLEYLIKCLEEKQVAQSVAKIISTQRSNGQAKFVLTYEKAMNIEPSKVNEKQLMRINFLRETSLLQFFRTGVKSLHSYVCHNYVGFRELTQNRLNITAKMKDKCVVQMMKKGACLACLPEIQHEMAKFSMCHHCKFLYPDYLLFTCKFASDKQAIPKINIEASCDPNLAEAFYQGAQKNRASQRFMTRKKNCLTSYAKIHDEYVCGRKYCLSCLKDTYSHESIKENGYCPFCLGACICTRCLRNEKIAKFKNMYSMLGGDLNKIQETSDLEQLPIKTDDQLPRGRGRPKKTAVTHISINTTQKKLRRFDEKENEGYGWSLIAKKGKRKASVYSNWKQNDSGSGSNNTQEEQESKRKKKRRVGRPRLDRKKPMHTE